MSKHDRDRRRRERGRNPHPAQYVQFNGGPKLAITSWDATFTETTPLIDGTLAPVANVVVSSERPEVRTPIDRDRN